MFRTSRTARRTHAAPAWMGQWRPPARGLRLQAASAVRGGGRPGDPGVLPPSQPLRRGERPTRTGHLAITRKWDSECRRVAAGSPTSTLPCSCRAPTGGGRSDRSSGLRAFPDPRACPSSATEASPRPFVDTEHFDPFAVAEEYWLSGRFIRKGKAARVVVRARHVGRGRHGVPLERSPRHRTASDKSGVRGHVLAREPASRGAAAVHRGHVDGQIDRARAHIRSRHPQGESVEGGMRAGRLLYEEQGCVGTLRLPPFKPRKFTSDTRRSSTTACVWDDEILVRRRGRRLFMRVAASDLDEVSQGSLRRCVCDGIFSRREQRLLDPPSSVD